MDHDTNSKEGANGTIEPNVHTVEGAKQHSQDEAQAVQQEQPQGEHAAWDTNKHNQTYPEGYGYHTNQMGYNGTDWTNAGGFNPMMQMQSGNWNNFPNMMGKFELLRNRTRHVADRPSGMAGMGMDPVAMSQGMFGGYGGQGMDMSGMSGMNGMSGMAAGMNAGNMGGMDYSGGFGGWTGHQAAGMNGDFGAHAGYYPGGGYNQQSLQGSYPHQMHHPQQQFQSNNFQNQRQARQGGSGAAASHRHSAHGSHGVFGGGRGPADGYGRGHGRVAGRRQAAENQNHAAQAEEEDAFFHQLPAGLQERRPSQQKSGNEPVPAVPADAESGLKQTEDVPANNADAGVSQSDSTPITKPNHEASGNVDFADKALDESRDTNADTERLTYADDQSSGAQQSQFNHATTSHMQPIASVEMSDYGMTHGNAIPTAMSPSESPYVPAGPASSYSLSQNGAGTEFHPRGRGGPYSRGGRGGFAEFRGGFRGRGVQGFGSGGNASPVQQGGDYTVVTPAEPKGQGVQGAPTGPKAMREGHPSTGFRGRGSFHGAPPGRGVVAPTGSASGNGQSQWQRYRPQTAHCVHQRVDLSLVLSETPERQRLRSKSRSRSRADSRHSRSPTREHRNQRRQRSRSYSRLASDTHPCGEHDSHRSSRAEGLGERDHVANGVNGPDVGVGNQIYREGGHSRSSSVKSSRRYSSRQDAERARPPRPHRHQSPGFRSQRRSRSRSRSPAAPRAQNGGPTADGLEVHSSESGRRSSKIEGYRERDRERHIDRDRDKDRDRDHDHDREHERAREKDRERERARDRERDRAKDRDRDQDKNRDHNRDRKRSRRDRDENDPDESGDDRYQRSSRRSRRDRDRGDEREPKGRYRPDAQERERIRPESAKQRGVDTSSPELEFKIKDRSKTTGQKPAGPSSREPPTSTTFVREPPKGPSSTRRPSHSLSQSHSTSPHNQRRLPPSAPAAQAAPAASDPHTQEREARNRERLLKEQQRRQSLQYPGAGGGAGSDRKRPHSAVDGRGGPGHGAGPDLVAASSERPFAPPTEPSAHRNSRRKIHRGSDDDGGGDAGAGGRAKGRVRGGGPSDRADGGSGSGGRRPGGGGSSGRRRMSYKYEDEENDEARARRVESEREAARWD